jgi:acetyl/propionyl-CoA carboxylase alpha subunit
MENIVGACRQTKAQAVHPGNNLYICYM